MKTPADTTEQAFISKSIREQKMLIVEGLRLSPERNTAGKIAYQFAPEVYAKMDHEEERGDAYYEWGDIKSQVRFALKLLLHDGKVTRSERGWMGQYRWSLKPSDPDSANKATIGGNQ